MCKQNKEKKWTKGCKKGDFWITMNYRDIPLTPIAAKIYNDLLLKEIQPEFEKSLRKNQNGFEETDPQHHKF